MQLQKTMVALAIAVAALFAGVTEASAHGFHGGGHFHGFGPGFGFYGYPYGYGYQPYYYAGEPACYEVRRRLYSKRYGWRIRRVIVCPQ
jgi:hypothetical protein